MATDAPDPLVAVSANAPPPPEGFVLRKGDWGAFRAAEPGTDAVLLLRPLADGLRIERPGLFETIHWADVTGVAVTDVRIGVVRVPVARILFRHGPSLDLADVLAPGADELPMSLEAGGPPLLRVERLRMVVAAIVSASGLSPRSRDHFHRGGRGVPVPELAVRPRRLRPWMPPLLLVASVVILLVLVPRLSFWSVIAIHAALFVHECGHAIAMRLLRTPVRGIVFIPVFGAATFPEHPFRTRWDDVCIALAGPLTGVPIAATALWLFDSVPPEAVQWGLLVAVAYNLLNLLPFVPMDGGRVLVAAVSAAPRGIRIVLAWAPLVAGVGLLVLAGPGEISFGLAVILALAIAATRLALRRLDFHQWVLDVPLDPASMRASLRDLTWAFGGPAREDVDGGLPPTPMTAGQLLATIGLYVALVAALAVATAAVWPLIDSTVAGL